MVSKTYSILISIIGAIVALTISSNGNAQLNHTGSWLTFTDMNSAVELDYGNGVMWGAAPGGAFAIDSNETVYKKITNIDGLRGLNLNAVEVDTAGNVWFGADNGTLNKFDRDGNYLTYYLIFEHPNVTDEPKAVYDIFNDGEWLWIAREEALSKFSIYNNGGEIRENIYHFGPFSYVNIKVCFVENDRIWFGCQNGIGYADKNSQILPDPTEWTVFHEGNPAGLGNVDIKSIAYYNDTLFTGTADGVFKFNEVPNDSDYWVMIGLDDIDINRLKVCSDTLFAATDNGLYYYSSGTWQIYQPSGFSGESVNDVAFLQNSGLWIALTEGGFGRFSAGSWEQFFIPGPRGQTFGDIAATEKGVWAVARGNIGFAGPAVNYYDYSVWKNINTANSDMTSNAFWSIAVDSLDRAWIGFWGNSIDMFDPADSSWTNYNHQNSPILGVEADENYIAISSITVDRYNNVYIGSYSAAIPHAVFIFSEDSSWSQIQLTTEGLSSNSFRSIVVENGKALFMTIDGIDILNYGSNIKDTTDYQWMHFDESSGLYNSQCTDAAVDLDGTVWIGTEGGLNYYDVDFEELDSLTLPFGFGPMVTDIEIDGTGNKWIATSSGLVKLSPDNRAWTTYSSETSGLVDDDIVSLSLIKSTGILWIGTKAGMSCFDTGLEQPSADLSDIGTYPSPAGPKFSSRVYFSRVPFGAVVYIYNIAGEKIREISSGNDGGLTSWNYLNDSGEICAAGVYIYYITTSNNEYSHTGKLVLIR
ncbi:MAG: hypothetical protein GY855_04295 [candidate division Zixibacteria bacterium]|nr:hypothetical protein [candidate division Zixibacteria bacterium]